MEPERRRQVESIFGQALEADASDRKSVLDESCAGDDELRREVESLFAQHDALGDFIDTSPVPALSPNQAPLTANAAVGHYRIVRKIGSGGMGTVYEAEDMKLRRRVALKFLPDEFAKDAQWMNRFRVEARAASALNHPNICTIYEVDEFDGRQFLAMELLEGQSLRDTIDGKQMPLKTILDLAVQIAFAIDAAHSKGIVHRDIKPANIFVTAQRQVKILDFGIAKLTALSQNPDDRTLAHRTQTGMVVGSAGYMSPEQVRGETVDHRSDIFAFGCVLYEMLTGQLAFDRSTMLETMVAVMNDEPPEISETAPATPLGLQRLVHRCLEKNPGQRFQSAADLAFALQALIESRTDSRFAAPVPAAAKRRSRWLWATAISLPALLLVFAALAWRPARPDPLRPMLRLNAEVGKDTVLAVVGGNSPLAISPDGTRLAFTFKGEDGKPRLGTRLLQQSAIFALNGTEDATEPFFSPDGKWIGFFAHEQLKKISVDGAIISTLCAVRNPRGASWGADGNVVLSAGLGEPLSRVSSEGGKLEPLTQFTGTEHTHRWPQVLPDGQHVLFTAARSTGDYDNASIELLSLKTGERKTLMSGGFSARYVSSNLRPGVHCSGCGHLIYLNRSTLFAAPFDIDKLSVSGPAVPILDDVASSSISGGDFAVSDSGLFAYLPSREASGGGSIAWLDAAGKRQVFQAPAGLYSTPRIAPDGKRVALAIGATSEVDIWVKDLERDTFSRLTFLGGDNRYPVWTPDGRNILFLSHDPTNPGLYLVPSDGSGEAKRLTDGQFDDVPFTFTPDGKRLAFHRFAGNGSEIWTAPLEGDPAHPMLGKEELFLESPFVDLEPAISPDGHWLAYASNESGTPEVYVRAFPGPGGKWQISTGSGHFPVWSRAGHELFFEKLGEAGIMSAAYTTSRSAQGETFTASTPRMWSSVPLTASYNYPNYDLAPDGKRIIALLAPEDAVGQKPLTHLTFLLNFFDELQRKAPGKN